MINFISSITLVLICLGSTVVDSFMAKTRIVTHCTFKAIIIEQNEVKGSGVLHCKSCSCGSSQKKTLRNTSLLASSGGAGSGAKKSSKSCTICKGKGANKCVPCAGSGIDKINGNIFERWTCNKCKGFGLVSCSCTGEKGLTPEQRGER